MHLKYELEELRKSIQPLLDRERMARELQKGVPNSHLFFGLTGISYDGPPFDIIPGLVSIRSVSNPPGVVHVLRAADRETTDYLGVARYSPWTTAELAVGDRKIEGHDEPEFLIKIAWHTVAMLKLRGMDVLTCPSASTVSWDTVAAVDDSSVHFTLLDDIPRQITLDDCRTALSTDDLEWVRDHFESAFRLRDASNSRRFGLAFNVAYTWNHTTDPRIAIANLWCGLEALFGLRTDRPVTRRLVERIVEWIPNTKEQEVLDLYNARCDAVHGRWLEWSDAIQVLEKSKYLLLNSLARCIEDGVRTLPDWQTGGGRKKLVH